MYIYIHIQWGLPKSWEVPSGFSMVSLDLQGDQWHESISSSFEQVDRARNLWIFMIFIVFDLGKHGKPWKSHEENGEFAVGHG